MPDEHFTAEVPLWLIQMVATNNRVKISTNNIIIRISKIAPECSQAIWLTLVLNSTGRGYFFVLC